MGACSISSKTLLVLSAIHLFSAPLGVPVSIGSFAKERLRLFSRDGDIDVTGIFPLHTEDSVSGECSVFRGYQALWLALPFIDVLRQHNFTISARTPDGKELRMRVGYTVVDQCEGLADIFRYTLESFSRNPSRGFCKFRRSSLTQQAPPSRRPLRTMAVVGPIGDRRTAVLAPLNSQRGMAQLTPFVSGAQFSCVLPQSDGCGRGSDFEYLFRLATTDPFTAQAILDLLLHFGWSHFALVTAGDDIACNQMMYSFLETLSMHGLYQDKLCMADRVLMDKASSSARQVYQVLQRYPRAKVVVLFAPPDHIEVLMETILNETEKDNTTFARIWIGFDRWSLAENFVFTRPKFGKIMQGVLVLRIGHYQPFRNLISRMEEEYVTHALNVNAGMLRRKSVSDLAQLWCQLIELHNYCEGVCDNSSARSVRYCSAFCYGFWFVLQHQRNA